MIILAIVAAAIIIVTQALLMAAEWFFGWLYTVAIWRRMSPAERKVGHVSFAQAEQWRREMLVGHLSWAFWCLSHWYQIAPRIVVYLVRKGVRRD